MQPLLFIEPTKQKECIMKKSAPALMILIAAVMIYGACGIVKTQSVSRGYDIQQSEVNNIQKGITTEKDVVKMFGPPTKVRDDADGGKEYFYDYARSGGPQWNLGVSVGGGTVQKSLLVWLDKNGVVTDYAYKQS
jgi:outer membrane protein assembly factor BamE (lipoprotein component of BamABCDE complex)